MAASPTPSHSFSPSPLPPILFTPIPPVLSPQERAEKARQEKADAEKRLSEAETRLRLAIEELHKNNAKPTSSFFYGSIFSARHALCGHGDSCVANSLGSLCQSFLLAYGVRVGIGVLLRAFKLLRSKRPIHSVLDLQLLLSEKNFIVREEACRIGLLFGGFSGLYHAVRCSLRRIRGRETPINAILGGSIAGLSILSLENKSKRRSFALYLLARVAQCAYNSAEAKGKLRPWSGHLKNGDTLLFSLASAQIMYAFIMRPETLPESYWDFIERTGPIPKPVLRAVRGNCRGQPLDMENLTEIFKTGSNPLPSLVTELGPRPPILPCSLIHPHSISCIRQNGKAIGDTFRKTFPLYMSLTLVPYVVLNLHKFMQAPVVTIWTAVRSAVRSTTFISVFVGIYQGVICMQRKVMERDHKAIYWFAGLLAGLSALIEKPARRKELALYTLPRAADSLWYIFVHRHLLPDVRYAEVALFCGCMGAIMYYHEYEACTMAPFLRGIITRFLNRTGFPLTDPTTLPLISPASFQNLKSFYRQSEEIWPPEAELDLLLDDNPDRPNSGGSKLHSGSSSGKKEGEREKGIVKVRETTVLDPETVIEKLKAEAFQGL